MDGKSAAVLVLAVLVGGCSKPQATQTAEKAEVVVTAMPDDADRNIATAEAFIDAFYSFNPAQLDPFFTDPALAGERARASAPGLMYYQGWAEGGNYKVLERAACVRSSADVVSCSITVQDDPVLALRTNFNATDTFTITFEDSRIVAVETSSNDQPVYYQAREWVAENLPEVMTGPCLRDDDKGGPTPGDCARAMAEGYRLFAESDEYPL